MGSVSPALCSFLNYDLASDGSTLPANRSGWFEKEVNESQSTTNSLGLTWGWEGSGRFGLRGFLLKKEEE